MDIAVQRFRGALAFLDGVDDEFRAVVYVAADEDVRLCGLVGQRVRDGVAAAVEFHPAALQQAAPFDGLTDGKNHMIRCKLHGFSLVVNRREALGFRVDGAQTLLEHHGGDMAGFVGLELLWAPAVADVDVLGEGLLHLVLGGGHGFAGFQADHGHLLCAETGGGAGAVHGHVAAADDHDLAVHMLIFILQRIVQEVHRDARAERMVARHAGIAAALAADGDIEGQIALLAQLGDGHILADLHAAAEFHAELAQHVDLRGDHVLFQLEGGDAVGHHAAGLLVLFKHRGLVALRRQIVGGAQAGRRR